MNRKWVAGGLVLILLLGIAYAVVSAHSAGTAGPAAVQTSGAQATRDALNVSTLSGHVRRITLVAEPGQLTIHKGLTVPVWTYNGTVPGPELRVTVGDTVQVTLVNHLPEATTIHWHGLIAPNSNDGVSGVTQDAVRPGASYTYTFVPQEAGTYLYHAHHDTAYQDDQGLYGALVVQPRRMTRSTVLDKILVLDDWNYPRTELLAPGGQALPNAILLASIPTPVPNTSLHAYLADPGTGEYATFTVNGHAYPDTAPIQASPGTLVRLRLINAGYVPHVLHLHGAAYRLIATDGSAVQSPPLTADLLPIAPGQRLDITFIMPRGTWSLHDHDDRLGGDEMRVLLGQGRSPTRADQRAFVAGAPPVLDLAHYGRPHAASHAASGQKGTRFDRVVRLELENPSVMGPAAASMGDNVYPINRQIFPLIPNIVVTRGQRIELIFVNKSSAAHPMSLNGHHMQVLTLNDEPVTGSPLFQDTVMVVPGKTTTVAFTATNPGVWMLQCYEMHHALGGMDLLVTYTGFSQLAQLGGPAGNIPY